MLKYKIITIDLYRHTIVSCIGDWETFIQWFKEISEFGEAYDSFKSIINENKPLELGKCYTNSTGDSIILVKPWNNIKELSNLVHETGHAAISLLEYIGCPINWQSDEAFTYLQEYIFRECVTDDGYVTYNKPE